MRGLEISSYQYSYYLSYHAEVQEFNNFCPISSRVVESLDSTLACASGRYSPLVVRQKRSHTRGKSSLLTSI